MEPINFSQYRTPQSEVTYSSSIVYGCVERETTLNDLYTTEYKLIEPMPILLRYEAEDRCFVAIQNDLNLWGEERTLQGAEKDLAFAIIKLYKKLSSLDRNVLGPYPTKQLTYLQQFIS
ncbi:MAG: hypothetical protein Q8P80_04430 [Candidatus Levybacteria bacterium]|nr:hypothetical protein [Candidatus Levybacteria bacterium]